ncbi:hypothetical protein HY450_01345 [Candidatus Pacearchaeota archaeon]|nr:hypothetical protein [Candidatus Pacearchaeota archaeon]
MKKKGQAALEFLMTYGWAILAAIIAIGVLAYFGVFSPGKYITGSAVVNPPFYVNAWNVQADTGAGSSGVTMELRNNGGEDYEIQSVDVTGCGTVSTITPIAAGATATFIVDCGVGALNAGETFKGDVTITYQKTNSNVDLTSSGTVAEKVTA